MVQIYFVFLVIAVSVCHCQDQIKAISNFDTSPYKPAFTAVIPNQDDSGYYLGYSSFSSVTINDSALYLAPAKSGSLLEGTSSSHLITGATNWPNEVRLIPIDVFNGLYAWSIAAGFFVGNAEDGGLYAVDMTNMDFPGEPVKISSRASDEMWYYHRVEWIDMDQDGDKDALTARAYGSGDKSELIWFENPNSFTITPSWQGHVLNQGKVDISFCLADLPNNDGSSTTAIIGSGFWGNELTITWSDSNNWLDLSSIQTRTIDTEGYYFDVEYVDINNDGLKDLLVTTWSQPPNFPGLVIAYELPMEIGQDWRTDDWTKHVMKDGFKLYKVQGKGSPGTARTFYPVIDDVNQKPLVMLTGDDDGNAYVLHPQSSDPKVWTYDMETFFDQPTTTVGQIGQGDVNGDGYMDFFVPAYNENKIFTFTYGP